MTQTPAVQTEVIFVPSCDTFLAKHLEIASSWSTYISKTIQNELIEVCGSYISAHILENVRIATYFSLTADEATAILSSYL